MGSRAEVGGFECYLAADEEETVEAQEVYRGDTEGPLARALF